MPLCPYILKCVHHFRGLMYPFETQLKDLTSQQKKPNCAVCGDQEHRFPITRDKSRDFQDQEVMPREGREGTVVWLGFLKPCFLF